jgi:ankyrin repeat protein
MPSAGSALFTATVASGKVDKARELLASGCDPNFRDNRGCPVLHWACNNGHVAMATLLLDAGALVDATDREGQTALHLAAEGGKACNGVVELLLKRGASVDALCAGGDSPLLRAAKKGSKEAASKLIIAGADRNRVNGAFAPRQWASINDNKEVFEVLRQKGAKSNPQFNSVTGEYETRFHDLQPLPTAEGA